MSIQKFLTIRTRKKNKNMESLPRVLKKREANRTREIMEMISSPCAIEIKQTKTNTLYANSVKPHQIEALKKVKHDIFRYKIPDMGQRNPFDAVILRDMKAYVVILFGNGNIIAIDVDKFPPVDQKITHNEAISLGYWLNMPN